MTISAILFLDKLEVDKDLVFGTLEVNLLEILVLKKLLPLILILSYFVKTESGRLNFFLFFFLFFYFPFYFSIFYFGTRVRDKLTRSHGHKSHDLWKNIEGSGKMKSYSMCNTYRP